ncbi:MAG: ABC transporter ATP-binding protein [Lachnospiraceae bacterium]|nr:ABC transporter ATP-binding protein [Lachnospiraceae bacterium]
MIAIECEGISKSFGNAKALENVSCALEEGKIYALLGRNGAGKTTLLNCLCTKYLPDCGEIKILEEKAYENEKVLSEICFLSDYLDAFTTKKVNNILKFASTFYPKWDNELMERLLAFFEINKKSKYDALSKGRQTAVSIVIGLCSGCQVVLLDEIYSGLDAVARQGFYQILLSEQEKNPRTFVLSTHLIEEMSGLFDHVVMIDKGKVILDEEIEGLHEKAYKCIGRAEYERYLQGKNVICKKQAGAVMEYDIYGELTWEEQKKLEECGFGIDHLSLQELFVAFTADSIKEWR